MVELRIMISEGGKTCKKILPDQDNFSGMKIGDKFSGDILGAKGFEFQITGGSDDSGFPMRPDLQGTAKRKLLVAKGFGAKKLKRKGELSRKTVRGNTVSKDTAQINVKVVAGKDAAKVLGLETSKEEPAEKTSPETKS